jgi:transposase-like protein
MAKLHRRYTTEFREQMVAGRSCNALAKEFGVSNWAIRQWVKQADGPAARRDEGLTRVERDELVRLQRENRRLKEDVRNPLKSHGLVCQRETRDTEALFGFVKANRAYHSVTAMCRVLKISKSDFYAWDSRPMSARARVDIGLTARIHDIHRRSNGIYGAPNVHAELADDYGIHVGCKRVAA